MVNFNGDLLPATAHFLNHTNRGLRFGDALSETVRFDGSRLLFWEDHYFLLMASMRQVRMEIPMSFSMEYLEAEIRKTLEAGGRGDRPAAVRITVFRADGTRLAPDSLEVRYVLEAEALENKEYELVTDRCRADLFKDYTVLSDELSALPQANALLRVLGTVFARENGLETCLLLNQRKEVCDALDGALFARFGTRIATPPAGSGCLDRVMRKRLLETGRKDGAYYFEERVISPFELQQADELFTAHVTHGLRPITEYRKARFGTEAATHLTDRLNAALQAEKIN